MTGSYNSVSCCNANSCTFAIEYYVEKRKIQIKKTLKTLYGPFSQRRFNCLKAREPLRGESLLFTTKSGTHFIELERTKG